MASFLAAHHGNSKRGQTTGHPTEPPRLRKSCDYCVRMKRGCDGTTPCELCRRRNKQCIRSLKKRSGPAKGAKYRKRGTHHAVGVVLPRSPVEPITKAAITSSVTKCRTRSPCRPTPDQDSSTTEKHGAGTKALVSAPTQVPYGNVEPSASGTSPRASITVSPDRALAHTLKPTSAAVTPLVSPKREATAVRKKQENSTSAAVTMGTSQSSWSGTRLEATGGPAVGDWDCRNLGHDAGVASRGNFLPIYHPAGGAARTGPDAVPGDMRASSVTGDGSFLLGNGGVWNTTAEVAEWRRGSLEEVLFGSCGRRTNFGGKSQVYVPASSKAPEYPQFLSPSIATSSLGSGAENRNGVGLADLQSAVLPPKANTLDSRENSPGPSLGELLLGEIPTYGLC